MIKQLDIPPVWLAIAMAIVATIARFDPDDLSIQHPVTDLIAGLCIGAGLILIILALIEMRKHKTTFMPHGQPEALVQNGIFQRSRNPIYLGDTLVLLGITLRFDAVVAMPIVPLFALFIEKRFILKEEARLRRKFRAAYAAYCNKVRRWL